MPQNDIAEWRPQMLSVLRAVAGLAFILHGTQKLLDFPPTERVIAASTQLWYAAVIELICGTLILIGLFTRPATSLASGTMAFAYWIAHAPRDLFPVNKGGDAAILYCFVFLCIVFAGPGPWSLDALRRGYREHT